MSELYRDFIEDQFDRVVNAINNELPTPTASDIGKVVQVVSDGGAGAEYALDAVPNELPTPTTSDIDKIVKVVSDGSGGAEYSLDNESQELPTPTTADIGKFATVVSDGSGGAEYALDSVPNELPTPTTSDIDKIVKVVSDGSGGAEYTLDTPSGLPAVTNEGSFLGTYRSGTSNIWGEITPPTSYIAIPFYSNHSWHFRQVELLKTATVSGTSITIGGSDTYADLYTAFISADYFIKHITVGEYASTGMFNYDLHFKANYVDYPQTNKTLVFSGYCNDGTNTYSVVAVFKDNKTGTITKTQI